MGVKWDGGVDRKPTLAEIKENRYSSLKAYQETAAEFKQQAKSLQEEIAGLEKEKGLKSKHIEEQIRQMKHALKTTQDKLNDLIGLNKVLERRLKKEIVTAQERQARANKTILSAAHQKNKAVRSIAENDQKAAEREAENKAEKDRLRSIAIDLNQREFTFSKSKKVLFEAQEVLKDLQKAYRTKKYNLRNSEELAKSRTEIAGKNIAEAKRLQKVAEDTTEVANKLMAEANNKMIAAAKREDAAAKKEVVTKDRDKSLMKLKAELEEKEISQGEKERHIGLQKRDVDKKIAVLKQLRKEKE